MQRERLGGGFESWWVSPVAATRSPAYAEDMTAPLSGRLLSVSGCQGAQSGKSSLFNMPAERLTRDGIPDANNIRQLLRIV
jgi:hypothetical protein